MNDVFICDFVRTPIGRYGGGLARVRADDLAAVPLAALMARNPSLDPAAIDEVMMGCANQAGEDNRNVARMALLLAGIPHAVTGVTVNRLCASGLEAVIAAARAIRAGECDLVVAGGVESMTRAPFVAPKAEAAFARNAGMEDTTLGWRMINPRFRELFGVDQMSKTAENVAEDFNIRREDQDAFALRSQVRGAAAQASGRLAREIVPVPVQEGRGRIGEFVLDEHLRPNTTHEELARLRPIVRSDGTVTAGNSSGLNDGAAALLLASEAGVAKHGLKPLSRVVGAAAAGVLPRVMGIGPVPATRKLLERQQADLDEIDIIEINEAFAAQVLACLQQLGVAEDDPRVNRNGGAIALGHPLGMSGARLVGTASLELAAGSRRRALVSMCVGVGQGVSLLLSSA